MMGEAEAALARALEGRLAEFRRRLELVRRSRPFRRPLERTRELGVGLDQLAERLARATQADLARRTQALAAAAGRLDALSPLKVLARGYSVTLHDGRAVTDAAQVKKGDALRTILRQGEIRSQVL